MEEPPSNFVCPVSFTVMQNPVRLVATGKTYEQKSIAEWFALGKKTCPATGQKLTDLTYELDTELIDEIAKWIEETGWVEDLIDDVDTPTTNISREQSCDLMRAAKFGFLQHVQEIKEQGCDLNVVDVEHHCYTALHWAAQFGRLGVVQYLVEQGLNLDQGDSYGLTPLHLAAFYGKSKAANKLLQLGAHLNLQDKSGATALHMAARKGHTSIVISLIESGADKSIRDKADDTARDKAGLWGRLRIRRLLK